MFIFNTYFLKLLISLLPIIIVTTYLVMTKSKAIKDEQKMADRFNKLNQTIAQKTVSKFLKEKKEKKATPIDNLIAKLHLMGIDFDVERMTVICIVGYIASALISHFLIGAGIILMIYLGIVFLIVVYSVFRNKINLKRKELRNEFMEKLRDIASQMSVGINFSVAVEQTLKSSETSQVMRRELESVTHSVYTGKAMSEAFYEMYDRLKIEEIREFCGILEVYEETGGKLSTFIRNFDRTFNDNVQVEDEKEIFATQIKSSQKFVIGMPVITITAFALLMPNVIKDYYASLEGQFMGMIFVTIMLFGAIFSVRVSGGE